MRILLFCITFFCALSGTAIAASHDRLIEAAEAAIISGAVDHQVHLQPLIDLLAETSRDAVADDLIDAISDLGDADGSSPTAVKKFLRENAPPALILAAGKNFDWTTRGDALMALRNLDASDEYFRQAIAVGRQDTSEQSGYINSRADLLQQWMDRRSPAETPDASLTEPVDAEAERDALAYLRGRGVGVSTDQAVRAASEGQVEILESLLLAGVNVNSTNTAGMTPLSGVTLGCHQRGEPVPESRLVAVMDLLHERGADIEMADSLNNTLLMQFTQSCPASLIEHLLQLGARPGPVNRQGFTPLAMAMVMGKYDAADALISHGAGLTQEKVDQLFFEPPSDPSVKALIERALANPSE